MARSCQDDRCEDIVVLDVRGLSTITDYFVIATGSSDRQIRSVADHLDQLGDELKFRKIGYDGREYGHWVLIDFGSVICHVFDREHRQVYDLELLWGDGPKIEWERPSA